MKVMIDPGHGGRFSGRVVHTPDEVYDGLVEIEPFIFHTDQWQALQNHANPRATPRLIKEKQCNYYFAILLNEELCKLGVEEVLRTRYYDQHLSNNVNKDLRLRAYLANHHQVDAFISIHCNAFNSPTANGYEVFTSPGQTASDTLATEILHEMSLVLPDMRQRSDLGDGDPDKEARFSVLVNTTMPAVLIELGFLTNTNDVITLFTPGTPRTLARHIAKAIFSWWQEKL
jgi:N-acetylmuramoyl-L-alanine amidase